MKHIELPALRVRMTPVSYVLGAVMLAEGVLAILCLSLPWGKTALGTDIRFGLAGLLPWFGFLPIAIQGAYLVVRSKALRVVYVVADLLLGAFILLVHYLTYVRYSNFQVGFWLVFVLGGAVVLGGVLCIAEGIVSDRVAEAAAHEPATG